MIFRKIIRIIYLLIVIVPLAGGIFYALFYSVGILGLLSEGFTLKHWLQLLQNQEVWQSLFYTFYLMILSLVLILLLALLVTWWWLMGHFYKSFYNSLFVPFTFSPLIAAFAWFYILSPGGVLSRLTANLGWIQGIEEFPRWVQDEYGIGILVTHVFLIFPLFSLLFIEQARKEKFSELLQVAFSLGSSKWQFFKTIFFPFLFQKTRVLIVLYAIFLMGTYEVPLLLGQSSPRVVTVFIIDKMTRFNLQDIHNAYALVCLYSVFLIVLISFLTFRIQSKLSFNS